MVIEELPSSSRRAVVALVYIAFVLDNMLLTVIVPILPEDLVRLESEDRAIFALPAVVVHQPNLLKTELRMDKDSPAYEISSMKNKINTDGEHLGYVKHNKNTIEQVRGSVAQISNKFSINANVTKFYQKKLTGSTKMKFTNPSIHSDEINTVSNYPSNSCTVAVTKKSSQLTFKSSKPASLTKEQSSSLQKKYSNLSRRISDDKDEDNDKDVNDKNVNDEDVNNEVGLVLAVRSLVQLLVTPGVAKWCNVVGYARPMIIGCCIMFASTITFACARSVTHLSVARSLHGLASSCVVISGLGLVASHYPEDTTRGRMLGRVQGGVALGVVLGYPLGGLLYHLTSSPAPPFVVLAGAAALLVGVTMAVLQPWRDLKNPLKSSDNGAVLQLVLDPCVATTCGAIMSATATFPVLESCLPSHLRATIHPERWELGAIFLPDSLGYFAAASLLAGPAHAMGRPKAAAAACLLVAAALTMIPLADSVGSLALPHLGVGTGVGAVDAALLPLLATHVDTRMPGARYATVYALTQSAVAGAYCLGPLVGVWLTAHIGFGGMLRCLALCNLIMCPLLLRGLRDVGTAESKPILQPEMKPTIQMEMRARTDPEKTSRN